LLEGNTKSGVKAMVIAPTRELALQIDQQIQGFAYFTNLRSIAIYGGGDGADWDQQKKALNMGVDIVVATPGKLISHLNMGYTEFKNFECLILDEADRMLDMGFSEDIRKIISYLPKKRQNLFFSATMPPKIRKLAKEVLEDPLEVSIAISKPAENILQASYLVYDEQKIPLLTELLKGKEKYESVIIFASRKKKVNEICRALRKDLDSVEGISSDLDQKEREKVVERFRSKRTRIVVSTDVLSRGIYIKDINLVINFDVPNDAEDYVHRIGRTARANTSGVAITLINKDDMSSFNKIERLIEKDVFKVPLPEHLGEGPKWDLSRRHYGKPKRHKSHRN
jgi:ATP-dependent RNA helicase RhlE